MDIIFQDSIIFRMKTEFISKMPHLGIDYERCLFDTNLLLAFEALALFPVFISNMLSTKEKVTTC